jgi:DNA-binding NtrC family response regulator
MPKLLIVEDMPDVARSYVLVFKRFAADVITASSPREAEQVMGSATEPLMLLCDNWLGEGVPTGMELVPRWRKSFPALVKTALVTGSNVGSVGGVPGIDAVFEKPPDIAALAKFFGLEKRRQA